MNDASVQVSIIMGIYNCANTLDNAVRSIINQTMDSWELIMCDDGSSDGTYAIAQGYQSRYSDQIKLISNPKNMGLNFTLNRCLELAQGKYIARQDGDDFSVPQRLAVQVAALEQHPEMAIISASMALFDGTGEWGVITRAPFPQKHDLIHGTPFAHAPCLINASALRSVGGYSENRRLIRVEDYHLWYKMYKTGYKGMNLSEVLYYCRDDRAAQGRRKLKYRVNECYVRWLVFKDFGLSILMLPFVIMPLIVGMLPSFLYRLLHKSRFKSVNKSSS